MPGVKFPADGVCIKQIDNRFWQVQRDHTIVYGDQFHRVPAGYITDLASIPRFFWRIGHPAEAATAAVMHDHLYSTGTGTRKFADQLFRQALIDWHRFPKWKATAYYWAVRLGGWLGWARERVS